MDFNIEPTKLLEILSEQGHIDTIYSAMRDKDMSEVVVNMLNILKTTSKLSKITFTTTKSDINSEKFRKLGDASFVFGSYKDALSFYNAALLHAPTNSQLITLAYSGRSLLLFEAKAYKASLKDIDTCFAMNCPKDIMKSLKIRKRKCLRFLKVENLVNDFGLEYLKFNVKRHPQIACASKDINVVIENQLPKIIAAKNIETGTVVALEPAYVSHLDKDNYSNSCYYCHKMSLNLKPCQGCIYALFCNEECEKHCLKEYHNIECQIMGYLEKTYQASMSRLTIKAAIKMKLNCVSWEEYITASYCIGKDRMKNSSVNEIYDVNYKFSILNFDDDRHFVHGQMYNASRICAMAIYFLESISSFLPQSPDERLEVIRALARIMMHMYMLFPNKLDIHNPAQDNTTNEITSLTQENYGWFSFTSKLSHCCDANVLVLGLKNNVALIALHPIKKGTELTISYIEHWYELNFRSWRQQKLFSILQITCRCYICAGQWNLMSFLGKKLTTEQQRAYRKWTSVKTTSFNCDKTAFAATCEALSALHIAINTTEHILLYKEFRKMLTLAQIVNTQNVILPRSSRSN